MRHQPESNPPARGTRLHRVTELRLTDGILVGWLHAGVLGIRAADWALLFLLGMDTVIRFAQSLKFDVEFHWGICEWLWPKR